MFSEIALHILDILQNSLYASATIIEIHIIKPINSNKITVRICDNGSGMTKMQLRKCFDPFFTTKENKAAGLGIPFFKYAAELSGGNFSVESDKKTVLKLRRYFVLTVLTVSLSATFFLPYTRRLFQIRKYIFMSVLI